MRTFMSAALLAATVVVSASAGSAQQALPPPPAAAPPPPAPTTTAATAAPKAAIAKAGANCLRLPLSDVAFGTENATNAARVKLDEYVQAEVKKRKWPAKPVVKSLETVSCEVYLNLGPLGTEYRCLVTATFCQK
jgi:hypothetical protein